MNLKEKKIIEGALREAQDNGNKEVVEMLNKIFAFHNGKCQGFNPDNANFYAWYANKPL